MLFLVLAVLVRRRRDQALGYVVGGLSLVFVVSLAFSVWYTAGGLLRHACARLGVRARRPRRRRTAEPAAGQVPVALEPGMGGAGDPARYRPGAPGLDRVPGILALLRLLILVSAEPGGADALLSSRALVRLGGISYGIYLWHSPLKLYRNNRQVKQPHWSAGSAIVLPSVLASLTQRYVDNRC